MPNTQKLLIQGGRVIDPSSNFDQDADILVENGVIAAIDKPGSFANTPGIAEILNAKGAWVMPGFIDIHVHLREPGFEYKETIETGTKAAVAGGFTSIACMANTQPVNDNAAVTSFIRERARQYGACRVYPIGAVTRGLKGTELAEIGGMVEEGVRALSDDGLPVMNSYVMRKAMDYAKAFAIPIISHAEDASLVGQGVMNESALSTELGLRGNPAAAEEIMVARDIALCRLTRCPVHFAHISTALAIDHIKRAKEAGLPITAEASPHHLTLTEENIRGYDTRFKVCPPLRSHEDMLAVRKALADGTLDLIASDHAPHGVIDKFVEFDQASNGLIGLQTTIPLTLFLVKEGQLSLSRWIESLTSKPAKLLGLPLGTLKKGAPADITIIDPERKWIFTEERIVSKSRNSPYVGHSLQGEVVATVVEGKIRFKSEDSGRHSPNPRKHS